MRPASQAAASASVSHPVKQGLVQVLSVFIDTILICTCSAVMIMIFVSGNMELTPFGGAVDGLTNMPLVQMSMLYGFGNAGVTFMTVAIFAFAFSSLIGNYFYAESNMRFIKDNKAVLTVFRVLCLASIMYGAVNSFDLAWNLADIFMGLMAMVNLVVILLLGKWALRALDGLSWAHTNAYRQDSYQLTGAIDLGGGYYVCDVVAETTAVTQANGEMHDVNHLKIIVFNNNGDLRALSLA